MTNDGIAQLIDHGKTALVYVACGVGAVVALLSGNTEAAGYLFAFIGGGAFVQGGSAVASKIKAGGGP